MIKRLLSAFVLIALTVYLVFNKNDWPFATAIAILSVWGVHEFYCGIRKLGFVPIEWAGIAGTVLFVFSAQTYHIQQIGINGGKEEFIIGAIFPAVLTSLLFACYLAEFFRKDKSPVRNSINYWFLVLSMLDGLSLIWLL